MLAKLSKNVEKAETLFIDFRPVFLLCTLFLGSAEFVSAFCISPATLQLLRAIAIPFWLLLSPLTSGIGVCITLHVLNAPKKCFKHSKSIQRM